MTNNNDTAPLWEEPGLNRKEVHRLAVIVHHSSSYRLSHVINAMRGHITRDTKRFPGNSSDYAGIRSMARELIASRAKGTPWPVIKTTVVYGNAVAGSLRPTGRGARSRAYQEQQALTIEVRTLHKEVQALKGQKESLAKLAKEQADELAKRGRRIARLQEALSGADTRTEQLLDKVQVITKRSTELQAENRRLQSEAPPHKPNYAEMKIAVGTGLGTAADRVAERLAQQVEELQLRVTALNCELVRAADKEARAKETYGIILQAIKLSRFDIGA